MLFKWILLMWSPETPCPTCVKVTVCVPCGSLRLYFTEYLLTELWFELDVSMKLWCVSTSYECSKLQRGVFISTWECDFKVCFCIPTQWISVRYPTGRMVQSSIVKCLYLYSFMISLLRVTTSESMIPRPCFQALNHCLFTVLLHVYLLPCLFQIVTTTYIHPYHLYFTISSPN